LIALVEELILTMDQKKKKTTIKILKNITKKNKKHVCIPKNIL